MDAYQILDGLSADYIDSLKARLLAKVVTKGQCWEFQGKRIRGYGAIAVQYPSFQKKHVASRVSYELFVGPIPRGQFVCHRCDNPSCVNPHHLFVALPKDNTQDMLTKNRAPNQKGQLNHASRLSEDDVTAIRAMYRKGEFGCKRIAKLYDVHYATIHLIVTGKTWGHI